MGHIEFAIDVGGRPMHLGISWLLEGPFDEELLGLLGLVKGLALIEMGWLHNNKNKNITKVIYEISKVMTDLIALLKLLRGSRI